MIVITIDMWPHGCPQRAYRLGRIEIANDGTGTQTTGNYAARFTGKKNRSLEGRNCGIVGFPRRSKTVFHLLRRVLERAGY